jgi:bacterioferritin-associated ferredoxin
VYVCHCEAVTDQTVDAAVLAGARTVSDVIELCRAGGGCGGCHDTLQALIDACAPDRQPAETRVA